MLQNESNLRFSEKIEEYLCWMKYFKVNMCAIITEGCVCYIFQSHISHMMRHLLREHKLAAEKSAVIKILQQENVN